MRPRKSRETPATAAALTSVERWICQNCCGSSSSTSSLSGLRISASPWRVATRVYLLSDWKYSTSSTVISFSVWPTDALIQRRNCRCGSLPAWAPSWLSTALRSAGGPAMRCLTRWIAVNSRAGSSGLSR